MEEGKKNLNVQIPISLHNQLKEMAHDNRSSLTIFVTNVLMEAVKQKQ